jgi:hypothetical protein
MNNAMMVTPTTRTVVDRTVRYRVAETKSLTRIAANNATAARVATRIASRSLSVATKQSTLENSATTAYLRPPDYP